MHICYFVLEESNLDEIKPYWEKLRAHHAARSERFAEQILSVTWDQRKKDVLAKADGGHFRLEIADDTETGITTGYCISTISPDGEGEIESIYIEEGYRKSGIGGALMKNALAWMDSLGVKRKTVVVLYGNEEAFGFYARYGFYPRSVTLNQPENFVKNQ